MPVIRITLLKGKTPEYLAAVSTSIYSALREEFMLSDGDRFHVFEEMEPHTFLFDRDFASKEPRTDDIMIIQIVADARRKVEKAATYKALCERLGASPGVKPQDIIVTLSTTNTLEDFSLGYGISADNLLG